MIALDAMGGDLGPRETVGGALAAAAEGIEVTLVGDEAILRVELAQRGPIPANVHIRHAPDVVAMGDHAAREVRRARETSMYVGTEMLKRGEADAFVTIGNTGAAMATSLVVLGRLKGVDRPALSAVLPGEGGPVMFMDVGANADARPQHLVQFAHLGAAYMRVVHGIADPRSAILSIGEEPTKGSMLVVEAHQMLAADAALHFVGNVESREILAGVADVIVTDGFTGNVVLKLAEGLVQLLFDQMRAAARSSLRAKITTSQPSRASSRAQALPMPRLPPVTIARLPVNCRSMWCSSSGRAAVCAGASSRRPRRRPSPRLRPHPQTCRRARGRYRCPRGRGRSRRSPRPGSR